MSQRVDVEPLISTNDFAEVKRQGKRVVTAGLILNGMQNNQPIIRMGYITSRHIGNAVARNRAKRRLRAVVREVLPKHGKSGYDLVLIGRNNTATRPFIALKKDFTYALHQIYGA
jgi:ribonuclease P protein component